MLVLAAGVKAGSADTGRTGPVESIPYPASLDAVVEWVDGKAYFFHRSEYVRYNLQKDTTESSHPKSTGPYWPGLWPDDIDAAVTDGAGKAYFFRGVEYIRYDIATSLGLNKPIVELPARYARAAAYDNQDGTCFEHAVAPSIDGRKSRPTGRFDKHAVVVKEPGARSQRTAVGYLAGFDSVTRAPLDRFGDHLAGTDWTVSSRTRAWPVRPIMLAFMNSTEDGAKTSLYCATSPDLAAQSGRYYKSLQEKEAHPYAKDGALAAELWERSARWTARWAEPLAVGSKAAEACIRTERSSQPE